MPRYDFTFTVVLAFPTVPQTGDSGWTMFALTEFEQMIAREDDLAEVLHSVRRAAREMGVIRQSYHFSPIFDAPTSARTVIYSEGYSEEWLRLYSNADFRKIDPIPTYTLRQGRMVYWFDALDACSEMAGVAEYRDALLEHGLIHGFGVPLFGQNGRNAYASFDFGVPREQLDAGMVLRIRTMAQIAHQRVCLLLANERETPSLSDREAEVLGWIAAGKSNTDIGTILGISAETVRTYTQRIYMKLDAYDRTSAVVRALKLGVLRNPG